jgi:hypothetical protein
VTAGINPEVLSLSRAHGVSIGAAHAMWLADPKRKPNDGPDFSMHVSCMACQLFHHIDDDCPALPRHYYEDNES